MVSRLNELQQTEVNEEGRGVRDDTATGNANATRAAKRSRIVHGEAEGQTNIKDAVARRLKYAGDQTEVSAAVEAARNTIIAVTPAAQAVGFGPLQTNGKSPPPPLNIHIYTRGPPRCVPTPMRTHLLQYIHPKQSGMTGQHPSGDGLQIRSPVAAGPKDLCVHGARINVRPNSTLYYNVV